MTTNHAFVGFWLDAGRQTVRLHYRPSSFFYGLAAYGLGVAAGVFWARRPIVQRETRATTG